MVSVCHTSSEDRRTHGPGCEKASAVRPGWHTGLGWTMFGNDCGNNVCYTCATAVIKTIDHPTNCLAQDLLDYCDQDFQDINKPQISAVSREDKRALEIMERTM